MIKSITAIAWLVSLLLLASCTRKEGCKDKNARNYKSEATKDCKCCQYDGTVVFWCDQSTADQLQKDGSSILTYYVNDVKVAEGLPIIPWATAPDCSQKSTVTIAQDMGSNKSQTFTYLIEDSHGSDLWIGSGTFEGNKCVKVQLER